MLNVYGIFFLQETLSWRKSQTACRSSVSYSSPLSNCKEWFLRTGRQKRRTEPSPGIRSLHCRGLGSRAALSKAGLGHVYSTHMQPVPEEETIGICGSQDGNKRNWKTDQLQNENVVSAFTNQVQSALASPASLCIFAHTKQLCR